MVAKSKFVTLLAACLAVGAAAQLDLPITRKNICGVTVYTQQNAHNFVANLTQQVCTSIGQDAVFNNATSTCNTSSASAAATFATACNAAALSEYESTPEGTNYDTDLQSQIVYPTVPVPASCYCESTAGANVTTTQETCTYVNNLHTIGNATMAGNDCMVTSSYAAVIFINVCAENYGVGWFVCSTL